MQEKEWFECQLVCIGTVLSIYWSFAVLPYPCHQAWFHSKGRLRRRQIAWRPRTYPSWNRTSAQAPFPRWISAQCTCTSRRRSQKEVCRWWSSENSGWLLIKSCQECQWLNRSTYIGACLCAWGRRRSVHQERFPEQRLILKERYGYPNLFL